MPSTASALLAANSLGAKRGKGWPELPAGIDNRHLLHPAQHNNTLTTANLVSFGTLVLGRAMRQTEADYFALIATASVRARL